MKNQGVKWRKLVGVERSNPTDFQRLLQHSMALEGLKGLVGRGLGTPWYKVRGWV